MESILIIDDDIALCQMLRDYFVLQKIALAMSHHGQAGLEEAQRGNYDIILLDVMLPGMDGFEVLQRLRSLSDVSVLLLTSRGDVGDRIIGIEGGADDYLPKPFNPRELLARIRAILRRRSMGKISHRLFIQGFDMDVRARRVLYRGIALGLTETEFLLLEALLESPGVILPRDRLVDRVFQRSFHPLDRSLDMLVSRLRRKLQIVDNPGALIKTIRSSGYLLAAREES